MINLYLIEDKVSRHAFFPSVISELSSFSLDKKLPFQFSNGNKILKKDKYNFCENGWGIKHFKENSPDVFGAIQDSNNTATKQVFDLLCDSDALITAVFDKYSIILLDINLREGFLPENISKINQCASEIKSKLQSKLSAMGLPLSKYDEMMMMYETINKLWNFEAPLAAILAGIRTILRYPLIIIGTYGDDQEIIQEGGSYLLKSCSFPHANDGSNIIKTIKPRLYEEIIAAANSLTSIHHDLFIDNALRMYKSQYTNKTSWTHDNINNPEYMSAVSKWCNEEIKRGDDIRALAMRDDDGFTFKHDKLSDLHFRHKYTVLSVKTLNKVLQTLNIPATVQESDKWWELPVVPGLTFLLSLREFLSVIEKEAEPLSIKFSRCGNERGLRLYSIAILLNDHRQKGGQQAVCKAFGLGVNYYNVLGQDLAHSDTTRALNNLMYARLEPFNSGKNSSGLKVSGDWLDIFTSSKHKGDNDDICPCVGVCFYPFGLRFVWAGEGDLDGILK